MAKFYKPFILASGVFLLAMLMYYARTGAWQGSGALLLLYATGLGLAVLVQAFVPQSKKSIK